MSERISPLRRRMIEDMTIRNLSPATQRSYIHAVKRYSLYFGRSPDLLGLEDVRTYQVHLVAKGIAWATLNQVVCALRFFYGVTLVQDEVPERIPYARQRQALPEVLSQDEVVRFLEAVSSLKCRVALTCAYATGLRVSEVVGVEVRNIDSGRMVIRIENGKGGTVTRSRLAAALARSAPRLPSPRGARRDSGRQIRVRLFRRAVCPSRSRRALTGGAPETERRSAPFDLRHRSAQPERSSYAWSNVPQL